MAETQTRNSHVGQFDIEKDTVFINTKKRYYREVHQNMIEPKENAIGNFLNFVSDDVKTLISLGDSFYHFWHDEIGLILSYHKHHKNVKIIIDEGNIDGSITQEIVDFAFKALDSLGVNYSRINRKNIDGILINNFSRVMVSSELRHNPTEDIYELVKPFIKNIEEKPWRNAYFSRSGLDSRSYEEIFDFPENLPITKDLFHDNRMDSHEGLENFFKNLGFEIIVPEKDFKTFEDQLNYVYSVKTFASLTSSGITNAAFMQPNQTVIEIVTPLLMKDSGESFTEYVHHFFSMIAFNKNHLHIGIPNDERLHKELIHKINSRNILDTIKSVM
jgi:hypothetical protein